MAHVPHGIIKRKLTSALDARVAWQLFYRGVHVRARNGRKTTSLLQMRLRLHQHLGCKSPNHHQRLLFAQALQHPWIASMYPEDIEECSLLWEDHEGDPDYNVMNGEAFSKCALYHWCLWPRTVSLDTQASRSSSNYTSAWEWSADARRGCLSLSWSIVGCYRSPYFSSQ